MPSLDELKDYLTQHSVRFGEQPIQHGTQLKCSSGEVFCHYTRRGTVVVQGRPTTLSQEVMAWVDAGAFAPTTPIPGAAATATAAGLHRDIFVVYGHDTPARENLELLLHKMGLNPIVLANLIPDGDTVIEKLEKYLMDNRHVGYACVLLTPDDEGYPAGSSGSVQYRARQNVILELGMVLAQLGRDRVAIFRKKEVEEPSDIAGLLYIPFDERPDEEASVLFRSLQAHGYNPNAAALT
jgi:predicted nucleotide-binding protein